MQAELLERFRQRDRRALARVLSLLARGEEVALPPAPAAARVVAVTGPGGVGKSTLVGKLIEHFRTQGLTIAVLACDPQSPLSGGALLGDRFRMPSRPDDDGVYIRSLAAASEQGPLAKHLDGMIQALAAFGFDIILVETAGAGQGDTAIRKLVDVLVLLLQPETGDDLQWEKAGVLEVADVIAVHKADLPGAESAAAQVRSALDLASARPIPVLLASSRTGAGIPDLAAAVLAAPLRRDIAPLASAELLQATQETLARRFRQLDATGDAALQNLLTSWQQGQLATPAASAALLSLLAACHSDSPK